MVIITGYEFVEARERDRCVAAPRDLVNRARDFESGPFPSTVATSKTPRASSAGRPDVPARIPPCERRLRGGGLHPERPRCPLGRDGRAQARVRWLGSAAAGGCGIRRR